MSKTIQENILDFDFKKSDTRYGPHGIHTWLAAMIPPLAKKLIEKTKPTNLLDPFSGGGTVCVEGILNKIPATAVDANPLSYIITKAKTTPLTHSKTKDLFEEIKNDATNNDFTEFHFPDYKEYRTEYWFKEEHFGPLNSLARSIYEIKNKKLKVFFQCVFSATVRDVSLTYRNEIRLRRLEPKDLVKFDRDVLKTFETRYEKTLDRLKELPSKSNAKVITGDVKKMPFKNNEFSTIICSPPYGDERNGVPYFQFTKNMAYWLGIPKNDLESYKKNVLGWFNKETILEKHSPESKTFRKLLKDIKSNQKNVNEAISFYSDYNIALQEMSRVTNDKIVIVIGNRVLNKTIVNNAKITTELFENLGIKLSEHLKRDLPSKRIPRFGDSKIVEGGQIDKEDILIYSLKK
ncbi:MAG: hypothetical protein OEW78_07185 [Nitrosopumilus sp.]|uniref:hypothetical protein n=1 Tax=Nitrosopumilus sp. TaxID=2024843 RepID=UPI00246A8F34|nr:hypothetical protein [Nitrosopumilus sp.]MDH5431648.1 hypothetical protein [Nitrosopumilus sp.]